MFETIINEVNKLLNSDITSYEINRSTGITRQLIDKYRSGKSEIKNMTLETACKLYEYSVKLQKEVIKMENMKAKVRGILEACTGGYYVVNIEADDFEDEVVCELDNEALYTALGFDWEVLSEIIEIERKSDKFDYPIREWDQEEHDSLWSRYDEIMDGLGDEAERYKKYDDIDWVEWEDTPAFEEMVDGFVDDLKQIIEENELTNYTLS